MGLKKFDFTIKDNKKKHSIIVSSIIVLVLLVGITIYATYAKYRVTNTYNIIQGKVGEFINVDVALNVKLIDSDGNETVATDFPDKTEYVYDASKSTCKSGGTITFDSDNWEATISAAGKDDCTIYFYYYGKGVLATSLLNNAETKGIYATAEDDYGTSYYLKGLVDYNYVKFGTWSETDTSDNAGKDMYWRIIRVNGDGTIRMIYDGIEAVENETTHTATIGTSKYSTNTNDAGYTYEGEDGSQIDSTIKGVVDAWYDANLELNYGLYIADRIFCNDKELLTESDTEKYYAAYDRISNQNPILTCTQDLDKYTVSADNGNGFLSNPVGLITADEVSLSREGNSYSSYLNIGSSYWTSTLSQYSSNQMRVYQHNSYNSLSVLGVLNSGPGVRPVINLNADVSFTGNGTINNPYEIK